MDVSGKEPDWMKRALSEDFQSWTNLAPRWTPNYRRNTGGGGEKGDINPLKPFNDFYFTPLGSSPSPLSGNGTSDETNFCNTTISDIVTDDDDEKKPDPCQGRRTIFLVVAAVVLLSIIAVAITVTTVRSKDEVLKEHVVNMSMKVTNRTYNAAMADPNSSEFRQFEDQFCSQVVKRSLDKAEEIENNRDCSVYSLEPGSVIVSFVFIVRLDANFRVESIKLFITNSITADGNHDFVIEVSSIIIPHVDPVETSTTTTTPELTTTSTTPEPTTTTATTPEPTTSTTKPTTATTTPEPTTTTTTPEPTTTTATTTPQPATTTTTPEPTTTTTPEPTTTTTTQTEEPTTPITTPQPTTTTHTATTTPEPTTPTMTEPTTTTTTPEPTTTTTTEPTTTTTTPEPTTTTTTTPEPTTTTTTPEPTTTTSLEPTTTTTTEPTTTTTTPEPTTTTTTPEPTTTTTTPEPTTTTTPEPTTTTTTEPTTTTTTPEPTTTTTTPEPTTTTTTTPEPTTTTTTPEPTTTITTPEPTTTTTTEPTTTNTTPEPTTTTTTPEPTTTTTTPEPTTTTTPEPTTTTTPEPTTTTTTTPESTTTTTTTPEPTTTTTTPEPTTTTTTPEPTTTITTPEPTTTTTPEPTTTITTPEPTTTTTTPEPTTTITTPEPTTTTTTPEPTTTITTPEPTTTTTTPEPTTTTTTPEPTTTTTTPEPTTTITTPEPTTTTTTPEPTTTITTPEPTTTTTTPEPTTSTTTPEPTTTTTTPEPTTTTQPASSTVPPASVVPMQNGTAVLGKPFTLECHLTDLELLEAVRFTRESGQVVGTFNYTSLLGNGSVVGRAEIAGYVVELTLPTVSCEDAGAYTCQALSDGVASDQSTAQISVTSPATKPTLTIDPYLVDGKYSAHYPTCVASFLGHNPNHVFSWVLKRNNGSDVEELPRGRHSDTLQVNESACESSGESELDPARYVGWNQSRLCCRLVTDDNDSTVVQEVCTDTIMLVPEDICREANATTLLQYPFDPNCYPYISCIQNQDAVYFNSCPVGAFCFNPESQNCDKTKDTGGEPSGDPWDCTLSSPQYIPREDTYPSNCALYQRCVNGQATNQTCLGGTVFTQGDGAPCTFNTDDSYCTAREPNETTTAGPAFSESTAEPTTTTTTTPEPTTTTTMTAETTNNTTTTAETTNTNTTTSEPITTTQPASSTVPPASVVPMQNGTAVLGKPFTLECHLTDLELLEAVRFTRESGQVVGTFNYTSLLGNGSVVGRAEIAGYVVELTLPTVSCEDAGAYTCQALSDGVASDQSTAQISVTSPATKPTLTIDPYLVDGKYSAHYPTCVASFLGHNPNHVFSWVLKRNNGSDVEELPRGRHSDTLQVNESACESSGESELDPARYVGWNQSRLCCRLVTDDNDSTVVQEVCTDTIMLVPEDICREANATTLLQYPFDPNCYPYISCIQNQDAVYFNSCPVGAFCFNPESQNCDKTKDTGGEPSGDPWDCTLSSPQYIPREDTYPSNCALYQRCVNGQATNQTCLGGTVFTQGDGAPCTFNTDDSYCTAREPNETTTAGPAFNGSTEAVSTTTANPFECSTYPSKIPLNDTYPNNCAGYRWCLNTLQSFVQACGAGTHFSNLNPNEVCVLESSNATYCYQHRAE